jgi:hypothetical protein
VLASLVRLFVSPATWVGLALATTVLVLQILGLIGGWSLGLAALGFAVGFAVGGLWLGFPRWHEPRWDTLLEFSDSGDARETMMRALNGVRELVRRNPEQRLPQPIQRRVLALCDALEELLGQWEGSKGTLSLEESFHARHIAIAYLPDALRSYLTIPAQFAATKVLVDGKTAQQTFGDTLVELDGKVKQLSEDLAGQDAQAFLSHSRFLHDKFGGRGERQALRLERPQGVHSSEKPHDDAR